jgi:predicted GNAT superfamily acetyltransferase
MGCTQADSTTTAISAQAASKAVPGPIELRPLATEAEFAACVRMQQEIWGDGYGELVPPIILQIVQKVGGVAVGAFGEDGALLGFVFGVTGVKEGRLVHWSHILAVRPELRNSGLGRRLKEHQRDLLAPLGVEAIYWTFDPLVAKNAHLNLHRLGAEVVEYVVEMYGRTGSVLHTLGTDRLVVAWRITGARAGAGSAVAASTGAGAGVNADVEPVAQLAAPIANLTDAGAPLERTAPLPEAPRVRIAIPSDLEGLLHADPELARRWQGTVRRSFLHYLGVGYRVTGFERAHDAGRCYYHLAAGGAAVAGSGPGVDSRVDGRVDTQ